MPTPRQYAIPAERQAAYRKRQAQARVKELQARGIPPLPGVATLPGWPRWNAIAQQILLLLLAMQEEMQGYYDDRSETWQESDRGDAMTERLQAVEEAVAAIEALAQ